MYFAKNIKSNVTPNCRQETVTECNKDDKYHLKDEWSLNLFIGATNFAIKSSLQHSMRYNMYLHNPVTYFSLYLLVYNVFIRITM